MCVKLYIGNLPIGTTAKELQDHFSLHGTVTSAKVMADRFTGRSRGYEFMEMPTQEEAEQVIIALYGRILEEEY
jgi:RNA recognition motif-containing protein